MQSTVQLIKGRITGRVCVPLDEAGGLFQVGVVKNAVGDAEVAVQCWIPEQCIECFATQFATAFTIQAAIQFALLEYLQQRFQSETTALADKFEVLKSRESTDSE